MSKIIDEMQMQEIKVLKVEEIPNVEYKKLRIAGVEYDPLPIFDAKNCVAIKSEKKLKGEVIEFI